MPPVARHAPYAQGDAAPPDEVIAGLRAANAQLRALLVEKDEIIAGLRAQVAGLEARAEALAAQVKQNSKKLQQAAVIGRTGQAGAEVAAEEDRPQARPPHGPAWRHDGADGYP